MKKELRFPLFILGLGLFISLYALAFTVLTGNALNRAKVKR